VRAAVIGTNWGRVHVAALRQAGVEVVALVGDRPTEVRSVADELGVRAAADPAVLHDLDLDLISVATPAPTHAAIIAALPDVAVLCEKPAVGLSPSRALPAGRSQPVWVNHAFAFLEVAERAHAVLGRLGPITAAHCTTTFDLPGQPASGDAMLLELASHPWSWLVHLFGEPRSAGPSFAVPGGVQLPVLCGVTPVTVQCVHHDDRAGISHHVVVTGEQGSVEVVGRFDLGSPWRFEAPLLTVAGGAPQPLGGPEDGLPDVWYGANARAIAAVVAALRGGSAHPALVQWGAALRMDTVAHAGLGLAPP
jgi:dTDP-4-dehydrorhamnose reductase